MAAGPEWEDRQFVASPQGTLEGSVGAQWQPDQREEITTRRAASTEVEVEGVHRFGAERRSTIVSSDWSKDLVREHRQPR